MDVLYRREDVDPCEPLSVAAAGASSPASIACFTCPRNRWICI